MIRATQARAARKRYRQIAPVLNEQSRRRFVALEARALGRGSVSLMARITGLARSTIYHGLCDIRDDVAAAPGRIRKPGGGRKGKAFEDATRWRHLKALFGPRRPGTPCECCCGPAGACVISPKSWGRRGTRFALRLLAICCAGWTTACRQTARHGKAATTSLATHNFVTSTRKRSTSSALINRSSRLTLSARNWSVISRTMVASGSPRVSPNSSTYMTSSIQSCAGQSRMGFTTSTPMSDGSASAPTTTRLHLPSTPSAGGGRRWGGNATPKQLKFLITVCHFPPGTSKWNKIEHRLFSFITINWRGKPLRTYRTIVQL